MTDDEDARLLTIFARHHQSKTLDQIDELKEQSGLGCG